MGTSKKSFGTSAKRTASRTSLGSMVRANFNNTNSQSVGFVSDKALQLVETPSIQPEVHSLAEPLLSYRFKVFHDNHSSVTICNNLFADDMIPVSLETPLPTRNFFEQFLATSSAFALESCPQSLEFEPVSFNLISAKELPIACDSNVVYSDINAQKSVRTSLGVDVSGKCDVKEHPLLVLDKQGSLVIPVKVFPVVFWNIQIESNPFIDGCEPDFVSKPSGVSLVKGKRHELLENWLASFSGFNRLKSLRSNTIGIYDKLRRQIKQFSCIVIAQVMKFISVVDAGFKSFISNVRNCFGILLHGFKKQFTISYLDFDGCDGFHSNKEDGLPYKAYAGRCPVVFGGWQFLPTLKSRVSLPYKL